MKLCVGAVSPLVVQEAAQLGLTIVASRRQVDIGGGYTGWDAKEFAEEVHVWPDAQAVRDHGGPLQGGFSDDGTASLDADVEAGFDALHIDVCCVFNDTNILHSLVRRYCVQGIPLEVGDEHATQSVNDNLLSVALDAGGLGSISAAVLSIGSFVWADSQIGTPISSDDEDLWDAAAQYRGMGVRTKAHNMDWLPERQAYAAVLDEYNLAPEIGAVEIDAILEVISNDERYTAVHAGYASMKWRRWFNEDKDEGTWLARAKCGLRYIRQDEGVFPKLAKSEETYVREVVRDALIRG